MPRQKATRLPIITYVTPELKRWVGLMATRFELADRSESAFLAFLLQEAFNKALAEGQPEALLVAGA